MISNEKQQAEFGKFLMVSSTQRAESACMQLSWVRGWKCSEEAGVRDTEPELCVCVALPARICMHGFSLSHPNRLGFHEEVFMY